MKKDNGYGTNRSVVLRSRVTPKDYAEILRFAAIDNRTLSDWVALELGGILRKRRNPATRADAKEKR